MRAEAPLRMRAREAGLFRALVRRTVAPGDSFPPPDRTDALPFFADLLRRSPRLNRIGLRALLYGERTGRLPATIATPLRTIALLAYYGDDGVMRSLGYDAEPLLARCRELRAREGRW